MSNIRTRPIEWTVDRLMCDCGGEFKHMFNISYADKPFTHVCEKCRAVEDTDAIYPKTVWRET